MINKYLAVIVTGIISTPLLHAQVDSFTLTSGTVSGGKVTLALSLNSPAASSEPAAVQWTLTYSSLNVASVTAVAGASLTSAAKTMSCAASAGSYACVASGMSTNAIANGVIASITFTMSAAASNTPVTLAAAAVNPSGGALNVTATGGAISGSGSSSGGGSSSTSGGMSVSSVTCRPATLIGGSPTTCTVTLTEAAPSGGQVVLLFALTTVSTTPASTPASITIPAGAQSGTFVVTTSAVTSNIIVLVSAEIGTVGKYTSIFLTPGPSPSARPGGPASTGSAGNSPPRLSCFPGTVTAPGTVTCELQLATRSAEARDLALSSSHPSLHVPNTVTVRPNQSSLSFQATVDETAPSGTLSIESSVGDRSAADRSSEERVTVIAQVLIGQVAPRKTADTAAGAASGAPQIRSVGNAASGSAESICAAGSLASIEGTGLALGEASDPSGGLALAGTRVAVSGRYVPLVYASGAKVVFVCPAGGAAPMSISLETGDGRSVTASVASRESAPGIFTVDGSGQGQAAATIFNGSRLAMARNYRYSSEPAQPGDSMSIAVTGLSSDADSGQLSVVIGDLRVPVDDVHFVTGKAGVRQIGVTIPSSAPTGDAVPIVVEERLPDGSVASSQKATIAIESVRQ